MKSKLVIITSTGLSILFLATAYFFSNLSSLLSPLSIFKPDISSITPKLKEKISSLDLDFSNTSTINKVSSPYYLLYNYNTGKVYASKGENKKISPASFTKLLTAQVVLDTISLDQLITVTKSSANKEPTVMGLKPGEQFTASDLIRGSIATSANDAAATLSEGVARAYQISLDDFISLMNYKAKLLQMNNSNFVNPEGFDNDNQYTTLVDMAKLANNTILNYPSIMAAAASNNQDIDKTDTHDHYYLPNWNSLLGIYPGVFGLKIARTEKSGFSSITTAKRDKIYIVAIISGAASITNRDLDVSQLLDYAFFQEGLPRVNINKNKLKLRYKEWADLAKKIRSQQKKQ